MAWHEELKQLQQQMSILSAKQSATQLQINEFDAIMRKYNITDNSLGYFSLLSNEVLEMIFSQIKIISNYLLLCKGLFTIITCDRVYKNTFYKALSIRGAAALKNLATYSNAAFEKYIKPLSGESYFTWLYFLLTKSKGISWTDICVNYDVSAQYIATYASRSNALIIPVSLIWNGASESLLITMRIPSTQFLRIFILSEKILRHGILHHINGNPINVSLVRTCILMKYSSVPSTFTIDSPSKVSIGPSTRTICINNDKGKTFILPTKLGYCIFNGKFQTEGYMIPERHNLIMFKKFIKKLFRGKFSASWHEGVKWMSRMSSTTSAKRGVELYYRSKYQIEVYIPSHYDITI